MTEEWLKAFKKAEKNPTRKNVCNAILECFVSANKDLYKGERVLSDEEIRGMVLARVEEICERLAVDLDNPYPDELKRLIDELRRESEGVRDKRTVEKHYMECLYLIKKLEEKEEKS